MKVKFFSLVAVLILVIIGFCIYLGVNQNQPDKDNEVSSGKVTIQPTQTPAPTVTPLPANYESDPGIYPAYQTINGAAKYGYVDSTGNFVIKPSFDSANDFHDGFATVTMDNQYLAVGKTGNIIYSSDNPISDFHNGLAVISKIVGDETLYGYIDTNGKEIIDPKYKLASDFDKDGNAYVYSGSGNYSKIDKTGKILKIYKLDTKYIPFTIQDGYIIYYKNGSNNYGVIDLQGNGIFKENYCQINYLGDNLFAIKKPDENYYGMTTEIPAALFNAKGEQLTGYILYDLSNFHNGYASVTDSTFTYFIDKDGKEATDLPKFKGRGTATLYGDVIKAAIDHDLSYTRSDNTILWQNATEQDLSGNMKAKEIKFKPNKYVLVYYPEITGLTDTKVQDKINIALQKIFTKDRANMKESDQYMVDDTFKASVIKNLLIIERDGYDYGFGAAHGMPIMDYYYIDITNGNFYQFKDLFIKGSDYIKAINKMINNDIADAADSEDGSMYFSDGFKTITKKQNFILTQDTVTIYFYPYDIAPYAAGFPKFNYSLEDLYPYINFKGAFWSSFN